MLTTINRMKVLTMSRAERRRAEREARKRNKKNGGAQVAPPLMNISTAEAAIRRGAEKELKRVKQEATLEALMLMFAIPAKVLKDEYWKKSYKQKLPEFVDKMLDVYREIESGEVDIGEMKDQLWEDAGIRFTEF